jgi:tRNA threonylcarbamoyladenosine biosynthesis protein TsaB
MSPSVTIAPQIFTLSIESSGPVCSIALAREGNLVAELSFHEPYQHDSLLAEAVRTLLAALSLRLEDVYAVCLSAGPGSFTGLRIGAAFVKAVCFDEVVIDSTSPFESSDEERSPRLIAVPTLYAIAAEAAPDAALQYKETICVVMLSHRNMAYRQRFSLDGVPLDDVTIIEIENLANERSEREFYCGSAFEGREQEWNTHPRLSRSTAAMVSRVGWRMLRRGTFTDADEFIPYYIQEFIPRIAANEQPAS